MTMSEQKAYRFKIIKIQERMWLISSLLGLLCMVFFLLGSDRDSALYFFGFFILSALFYLLRKQQRKRIQRELLQSKSSKQT